MNLKNLSDDQLISKTKLLAKQERELLTEVLHHLSEVGRRRLFSTLKYKSLFDYAVKELGYSEDQAYRRVKAAELLRQLPEIEDKIESGSLTLANLSVVASAVKISSEKGFASKGVKCSVSEVRKIVNLVEGKSKREAESILVKEEVIEAQELRPEKVRQVGESVEIRFTVNKEMLEKLQELKSLMAHSDPNITMADLFEKLCDEKLNALVAKKHCAKEIESADTKKVRKNRRVSWRSVKRVIWTRAKGQCENCQSRYALEVDHKIPKAKGGGDDLKNLRLLCKQCNQRAAIHHFGQKLMDRYLDPI